MGIMARNDAASIDRPGTALVALHALNRKPSLARLAPEADFLSQMIAERQHLASQRARRQAPLEHALDAYAEGGRRDHPRLPAGFFRSRLV
jgi:hypothetical protein